MRKLQKSFFHCLVSTKKEEFRTVKNTVKNRGAERKSGSVFTENDKYALFLLVVFFILMTHLRYIIISTTMFKELW